jgi:ATP-dependent helicase YprA (DUF1998 family)
MSLTAEPAALGLRALTESMRDGRASAVVLTQAALARIRMCAMLPWWACRIPNGVKRWWRVWC